MINSWHIKKSPARRKIKNALNRIKIPVPAHGRDIIHMFKPAFGFKINIAVPHLNAGIIRTFKTRNKLFFAFNRNPPDFNGRGHFQTPAGSHCAGYIVTHGITFSIKIKP